MTFVSVLRKQKVLPTVRPRLCILSLFSWGVKVKVNRCAVSHSFTFMKIHRKRFQYQGKLRA